jgi:MFS family permease
VPSAPPPTRQARRGHLIDISPLRESPAFARLWAGSAIAGIGGQMTIVAVGLHIYDITGSTFAVAMVGTLALIPMIAAGLYGGMLADAFDRRRVALASSTVAWLSTIGLVLVAWSGFEQVWPFYVLTTVISVAATITGTARQAIVPRLVSRELLPAASALGGVSMGVMVTVGPALAGVLVASVGFGWTYLIDVVLFTAAFLGIVTLPAIRPEGETSRPGIESVKTGLRFLKSAPNVRMSFIVDVIAMTFGRPHALFPAVGALVIGGGAVTVGVLTAASAIGTLVCSLFSGRIGLVRKHGVAIGWSIAVYGAFVAGFGAVPGDRGTHDGGNGRGGQRQLHLPQHHPPDGGARQHAGPTAGDLHRRRDGWTARRRLLRRGPRARRRRVGAAAPRRHPDHRAHRSVSPDRAQLPPLRRRPPDTVSAPRRAVRDACMDSIRRR